jgi:ribosome biogenesis protein YTM1
VKWHPTSPNIFASADYDGVVKIWDTRAVVPLGSTEAHTGKVLCVDWLQGSTAGEKGTFASL